MASTTEAATQGQSRRSRTVEVAYIGGSPYVARRYVTSAGYNFGGAKVPTGRGDRYALVTVTDESGRKVAGKLVQDLNGDGMTSQAGEPAFEFCGALDAPVKIKPGIEVLVYVSSGQCGPDPSLPTQGTVELTFSNLP